jgi:ATP-dependent Clp protease ATP-binding subunit ClpB
MKSLGSRLAEMNIELALSDNARSLLAEKGFDQIYGARPLKRAIQKYIENPLSMEILKGNISEGAKVEANVEGEQIVFTSLTNRVLV